VQVENFSIQGVLCLILVENTLVREVVPPRASRLTISSTLRTMATSSLEKSTQMISEGRHPRWLVRCHAAAIQASNRIHKESVSHVLGDSNLSICVCFFVKGVLQPAYALLYWRLAAVFTCAQRKWLRYSAYHTFITHLYPINGFQGVIKDYFRWICLFNSVLFDSH
jgi:hypothetical protein